MRPCRGSGFSSGARFSRMRMDTITGYAASVRAPGVVQRALRAKAAHADGAVVHGRAQQVQGVGFARGRGLGDEERVVLPVVERADAGVDALLLVVDVRAEQVQRRGALLPDRDHAADGGAAVVAVAGLFVRTLADHDVCEELYAVVDRAPALGDAADVARVVPGAEGLVRVAAEVAAPGPAAVARAAVRQLHVEQRLGRGFA